MDSLSSITVYLSDWGDILPKLCRLIKSPLEVGVYEKDELAFIESEHDDQEWIIEGEKNSKLTINFEKYESYYCGTFSANEDIFEIVKAMIYETYVAQGGNPNEFYG